MSVRFILALFKYIHTIQVLGQMGYLCIYSPNAGMVDSLNLKLRGINRVGSSPSSDNYILL